MLVLLSNEPRDYAWGSTSLLAGLEGRAPSGRPEAEVWFGDHPADPAVTADGRTLDVWLAEEGEAAPLPYLLKLLAAASPLSIQAHPSIAQAREGFAREEAAGIPRDAADRTYRDENHKPELLVALSDTFRALAGLRDLDATRRLVSGLGAGAQPLAGRLADPGTSLAAVIGWVLGGAGDEARQIIAAASAAQSDEFAAELALVRDLDAAYPGDPGIVVALLMNLVTLHRGEGLYLPAGVLHAYLEGLGVELMAASDNVLRGGLTPKHIDVAELLEVLDEKTGPPAIVHAREVGPGVGDFAVPVPDFALAGVRVCGDEVARVTVTGSAIALATAGALTITGAASGTRLSLAPGEAALVTAAEGQLVVTGDGELFVASRGR